MNLALGSTSDAQTAPIQAAPPAAVPSQTIPNPAPPQPTRSPPSTSSSNAPPTRASPGPTSHPVESRDKETTDEKKARLEAQKKALQAKDEARRAAEIRARRDEIEGVASKSTADKKYAMMQKKRAQDARDERARILKRVEDDKAERREREAQRKAEAKALAEGVPLPTGSSSSPQQARSTNSVECALQIRLFDGSTIRNRFPSSASLRRDVRPWIDEKQAGDQPYNFKQVLTPLPNKNIETSEEEGTLQSLGLTPSATLILVPIAAYSSAYEGGTGLVSRGVSAGYGLVSSGLGMVTGLLGGILGGAGATPPSAEEHRQTPTSAPNPNPSINIRTL